MKKSFFDVHFHIFNVTHIPMMTMLKRYGLPLQIGIMNWSWLKIDDRVRKYVQLSEYPVLDILLTIEKEILESFPEAADFEAPEEIVLTPLLMNFEYEDGLKTIRVQIDDTQKAVKEFLKMLHKIPVKVYPFLAVEPTKKDAVPLIKKYIKRKKGVSKIKNGDFIGVKVYPPLGLNIDLDIYPQLRDFFDYCLKNDIPITTHTAPGGFISKNITHNSLANSYCNPDKWGPVLEAYPGLRVNFAHFGAFKYSWKNTIIKFMKKYKNVYSDVSSVLNFRFLWFNHFGLLKKLVSHPLIGERMLYGTDYYIVMPFIRNYGFYKDYLLPVIKHLKGSFYKIAEDNPKKFLRL